MKFGIGLSNDKFEIVIKELTRGDRFLLLKQFKKYAKILSIDAPKRTHLKRLK